MMKEESPRPGNSVWSRSYIIDEPGSEKVSRPPARGLGVEVDYFVATPSIGNGVTRAMPARAPSDGVA